MAMQDYYEGQTWKGYPGAPNLVSWCVRNTEVCVHLYSGVSNVDRVYIGI